MKSIKIPKVPTGIYHLRINKSSIPKYNRTQYRVSSCSEPLNHGGWSCGVVAVTLKRQEVAGFIIPADTAIYVESIDSNQATVPITSDKLNALLRTLYLDQLRTVKKKL